MMADRSLSIAGRRIAADMPPYVVAEMSGNHNASLDRALAILGAAKDAGCDAVKLQTFTADSMTLDLEGPGFVVEGGLWQGRRLYDLYDEAHLPWDWHKPLFDQGRELGITVFSSPFGTREVEFLESLGAPAYKIASFELLDLPLIRCCAQTGKPLIMSTGMATADDISQALNCARSAGSFQIVLLHCVSGYPTPAADLNLRTVQDIAEQFDVPVGLSDHTYGIGAAVAAVALGATMIEKHFTLSRKDGGVDAAFSLEPDEMTRLCSEVRCGWEALGQVHYGPSESDRANVIYRRSLYAVADIAAGEELSDRNVRSIRPGYGLAPKFLDKIVGRRAKQAIARGTPLSWNLID